MPKRPNQKRQLGSLKIWWNEKTNTVWASVAVHEGRATRTVRGPEANTMETAISLLNSRLADGEA